MQAPDPVIAKCKARPPLEFFAYGQQQYISVAFAWNHLKHRCALARKKASFLKQSPHNIAAQLRVQDVIALKPVSPLPEQPLFQTRDVGATFDVKVKKFFALACQFSSAAVTDWTAGVILELLGCVFARRVGPRLFFCVFV